MACSLSRFKTSRAVLLRAFTVVILLSAPVGCASTKGENGRIVSDARQDPLEPVNRVIFDVNDFFDRLIFKPLAELYRFATPSYFRDRMSGVIENMNEPVVMANSLMQGRFTDAGKSLGRLVVNSTIGVGGAYDIANEGLGWPLKPADFGQTLSVWGAGQGPYLVLPFFGPSTVRDAVGIAADMYISPWGYVAMEGPHSTSTAFSYASMGATALVKREQHLDDLDKLKEGSIDFYAQMRSLYLQYRNKQLGIASPMPTSASYDEQ